MPIPIDKIFQLDTIEEGKLKLKEEIQEGDLILVDGSKEMKTGEMVEEITFHFKQNRAKFEF